MFKKVLSSAAMGIDGVIIGVEADISDGLPSFTMVGYLSSSVRESGERVRTALKNSGFHLPPKRITINLTPADIRKDGSGFDLPIAVAILMCLGVEPVNDLSKTIIVGELGLNGIVLPIPGVLPMLSHCYDSGYTKCIIPTANIEEASLIKDMDIVPVASISDIIDYFCNPEEYQQHNKASSADIVSMQLYDNIDLSEIKGQDTLKRGMTIAAAGFHNVLMTGAAGSGKSMLAKRLPTIMPDLTLSESMEITKIYSTSGLLLSNHGLITTRPFRSPHHTISAKALVGGGQIPRPGEVSLAHNGILFLDELPEFSKATLEVLRQPIEDRYVTISRLNAIYRFPSDFMLVAAMNPCPCGNYPNLNKCTCSHNEIRRYQNRISGPLLDRIDITMEVSPLNYEDLFISANNESSASIKARVETAREIQKRRYQDDKLLFNSQLDGKYIKKYITLDNTCEELLKSTFKTNSLSARGIYRILKLARTIADLDGNPEIDIKELREAIYFRNTDLKGGISI